MACGLWGTSALLLAAGVAFPSRLGPVQRTWMGMALGISKVTTPIFMGIIFFVVIAPIGFIMRIVGRNPVKHDARNGSYWTDHAAEDERGAMTNQF